MTIKKYIEGFTQGLCDSFVKSTLLNELIKQLKVKMFAKWRSLSKTSEEVEISEVMLEFLPTHEHGVDTGVNGHNLEFKKQFMMDFVCFYLILLDEAR